MVDFYDDNDNRINIQLAATEAAILNAAAKLYSARIIAGSVKPGDEKEVMRKCMKESVLMANSIDEMIKAEGEM